MLTSGDGKNITWSGLATLEILAIGIKYYVHDADNILRYVCYTHTLLADEKEIRLFFITVPSLEEQSHARATENKYSRMLISTITHDLKSPISIIKSNLGLLSQHVTASGDSYLKAVQIAAESFEYYIYDLIVDVFYNR